MTLRGEAFRFGVCTSAALGGGTAVDIVTIPGPSGAVTVEDQLIGGMKRSLDGTLRMDRFTLKRKFTLTPTPYAPNTEYWSVLRFWKAYQGPYIYFDQSVANLLTSDQKLLTSWTDRNGVAVPVRADGGLNLVASGVAQIPPNAAQMVPVTTGQQYTFGIGLCGAGGVGPGAPWWAVMTISWRSATGVQLSLSTTTLRGNAPQDTFKYLDGSLTAGRYWLTATAPAMAAYAQIVITNSGSSAVDMLDPSIIPGPSDVGSAYTLVAITAIPEVHHRPQTASLTLTLEEV